MAVVWGTLVLCLGTLQPALWTLAGALPVLLLAVFVSQLLYLQSQQLLGPLPLVLCMTQQGRSTLVRVRLMLQVLACF